MTKNKKTKLKATITSPLYWKTNQYFDELYESLVNQTVKDWELVVLLSNGGKVSEKVKKDKRVKIIEDTGENNNIGRLKRVCNDAATNDILVEVDADDILVPTALKEILDAFEENEEAQFVYSNCAEFRDKTWEPRIYGSYWGWRNRPFKWKGHDLLEQYSFPPRATTMWRIEWAPNHVRSWRKTAYKEVGGHNPDVPNGDDHELMCRFYIKYGDKGFHWINKCLYLYRVHDENYCVVDNKTVQDVVLQNYFSYSRQIAVKWAQDNKLETIDLGGRSTSWDSFRQITLEELDKIPDDSVGVIKCHEYLQLFPNSIEIMEKIWQKLTHGGILFLEVPSSECNEATGNPANKSFWNKETAKFYTEKKFADEIGFKGKFQNWRNETFYPTEYHKERGILITQMDLVAIKKEEPVLPGAQWM